MRLFQATIGGTIIIIIYLFLRYFLKSCSWNLCKIFGIIPLIRLFIPFSFPCPVPFLSAQISPKTPEASFSLLFVLYYVGAASLLLYFAVHHIETIHKCKPLLSCDTMIYIQNWKSSKRFPFLFQVVSSQRTAVPFVYGLFYPKIVLPPDKNISQKRLFLLLEHEYTHIIHFDILIKYMAMAALCVHWFNPMVWLLFFTINRDIEFACDESVLSDKNVHQRKEYAKMILSYSASASEPNICKGSQYNHLKKRILEILAAYPCHLRANRMKRNVLKTASCFFLILLFISTLFISPFAGRACTLSPYTSKPSPESASICLISYVPNVTGMPPREALAVMTQYGYVLHSCH